MVSRETGEERQIEVGPGESVEIAQTSTGRIEFDKAQGIGMDVIVELVQSPLLRAADGADRDQLRTLEIALTQQVSALEQSVLQAENRARDRAGATRASLDQVVKHRFFRTYCGLAVRIREEAVEEIRHLPSVKRVITDREVEAFLEESVALIQADRVWTELSATGAGVTIAIIDTGIDYTHPDLGECLGLGCKIIGGIDLVNDDPDPMDDHGHGTHVAGIAAANGTLQGVAPDARLLAVKVLGSSGRGWSSDTIAGIEWSVDPDGDVSTDDRADVMNLSLGSGGDPDDPVSLAVDTAVGAGIVVVVSAGNSGPEYFTVGAPASARHALTVGASTKADSMASTSSRGPSMIVYQIKPEITAPGVNILSTVPSGSCFLCNPSGYTRLSGTSMASPHVAGAAALLLELHPAWTPLRVKAALLGSAVDLAVDPLPTGNWSPRRFRGCDPHELPRARYSQSRRHGGEWREVDVDGGAGSFTADLPPPAPIMTQPLSAWTHTISPAMACDTRFFCL